MIDVPRLLRALYDRGHFWNPANQDGLNVDLSSVEKLGLRHRIAVAAIASWQAFDSHFSELARVVHNRDVVPDGDVGPVTAAMLDARRCEMPDFAPPPNASFAYVDPGLQAAVESYQRYAAAYAGGSGSWPKGCDPLAPEVHSVVVSIDVTNASSAQKSIIVDVLRYVEQTEAEIGQSVRHVLDGSVERPQHSVKFESIPGSVIGYAYFPEPNQCRQTVKARIDNTFSASKVVLAELLTHEYKGHSDGLEHTRGGIMNPSIGSPVVRPSWVNDPSYATKRKYFGGAALPPPSPVPPPVPGPVPSPTPEIVVNGELEIGGRKFIVVPKAEL